MSPKPIPFDMVATTAAARIVPQLIKTRARHYARRPTSLDALYPGLSCAAPDTLVAIATHLLARERQAPRRWLGFGGEVTLINARAALLLGRAQKRAGRLAKPVPQQHVSSLI